MLPELRAELSLHAGPAETDGSPSWTIRDPVRNRFFRISWPAFEILCRWHLGDPEKIADSICAETTLELSADDVKQVGGFLISNQLTTVETLKDAKRLSDHAQASKHSWFAWLLHHYLFFRIPVIRPDRWLAAGLPLVRWMGSGWFRLATVLALLVGLLLAGRQWDLFVATLVDTFSFSGLLSYALALSVVKVIHELAHGFTAKHHGCRVPSMGVAFLVLWPMLYTDVNDTWMLPERRKRLQVGSAGILAELTVAAWATLVWAFLPEGPLKQAAFILATLTWVSSLAINLSPFMRFDGYFIAMDALEMPNLHPRSFAMARWWMREQIFGFGLDAPEQITKGQQRALIAFAFAVWIYRLVLFLGIAVMVYHFFIKAVGILLFIVEIWWFVARPAWTEIREWLRLKQQLPAGQRLRLSMGAVGVVFLFLLIPWQSHVTAPAVLKGAQVAPLHLPFPAQLQALHVTPGQAVKQGDLLMTFQAPDIALRQAVLTARIDGKEAELKTATLDPLQRERVGVAQEDLRKAQTELLALTAESKRLTVLAPFDGQVLDLLPDLEVGDWVSPSQKLGVVVDAGPPVAIAYLSEDHLSRLDESAEVSAAFYPRALEFSSRDGRLQRVNPSPSRTLTEGALASIHGGDIPSHVSGRDIIPEESITRAVILLDGPAPRYQQVGTVDIASSRSSVLGRMVRSVMVVLIREWGV